MHITQMFIHHSVNDMNIRKLIVPRKTYKTMYIKN